MIASRRAVSPGVIQQKSAGTSEFRSPSRSQPREGAIKEIEHQDAILPPCGAIASDNMPTHKFKIGQTVFLSPSLGVPGGAYIVTKKLPERDGEFAYRVKSANEPHERVVPESQLSDVP
jgi:hypothetical protein